MEAKREQSWHGRAVLVALLVLALLAAVGWLAVRARRGALDRGVKPVRARPDGAELEDAIAAGDVEAVQAALEQTPTLVDARNRWGYAPLHLAARGGDAGVVAGLLDAGGDPNAPSLGGYTPLHLAARQGSVQVARLLLDKGALPTARNRIGEVPANEAFACGHSDLARLILSKGGETDIFCATALGDVAKVRAIMAAVPASATSEYPSELGGETPLQWAARWGRLEIARLLVAAGADVEVGVELGLWRPIEWAALGGHEDIVELLLASGTDVSQDSYSINGSALHLASLLGHTEIVLRLLRSGMVPNASAASDHVPPHWASVGTPLHWAAQGGRADTTAVLLARGAELEATAAGYDCMLSWHARRQPDADYGLWRISLLLKEAGIGVATDECARKWGLAELGKDVGTSPLNDDPLAVRREDVGYTALHWAARAGQDSTVKLLLDRGANGKAGMGSLFGTPLHEAAVAGHAATAAILLRHGADVNAGAGLFGTPLHWAARAGRRATGEFLLESGADVNARDTQGRTPLHLAAFWGRAPMAEMLIGRGADVNARDKDGLTPLGLATTRKHPEVAELLRQHGAVE